MFEFKSPRDGLTIDDYIKTIGYADLFKGLGKYVDEIPFSELTVTLVRDVIPKRLFRDLEANGGKISEKYPGIFYISGVVTIPTQLILTSSLDREIHASLPLLTENAREEDVINFLEFAKRIPEVSDRRNADALLSISISANAAVYENVRRRDPAMSEALLELLKDEIREKEQNAVDTSLIAAVKNLMKKYGWDANTAMESIGISESDQIRYAARL